MTERAATLVAVVRGHAACQPDQPALTFLGAGGEPEAVLTFAALDARARAVAAALDGRAAPGDRAVLLFPPGLDYAVAFLACLYAGVIAVPVYLPRGDRQLPRLAAVLADATPRVALTTANTLARAGGGLAALLAEAGVATLDLVGVPADAADSWRDPGAPPSASAFLQYTSGSTGAPRGVVVAHDNLMANSAAIYEAFGHGPDSLALLWVPPYHDMGLIGGILQPLYGGFPGVLMSPLAFLKHPLGWLRAIDRWGATTSGGPDFAYALCADRVRPADREGLDLSRWRVAFDGAEPVRAATLDRFAAAFRPCGFRREAFFPCYGLAEATLIVSGGPARTVVLDADALTQGRVVMAAPDTAGVALVTSGAAASGQAVRLVDPLTARPCAPGEIGEIWVAGPSVARGYWRRPDESAATFGARLDPEGPGEEGAWEEGPFLRTGDLGFLAGGELVVTGRLKDVIIVAGRNHYPHDLEATATASHPALRSGGAAAFTVPAPDTADGVALVVVAEADRDPVAREAAIAAVRRAIAAEHDLVAADVVLIAPGTLPRTSSGKVRRGACREAYEAGT